MRQNIPFIMIFLLSFLSCKNKGTQLTIDDHTEESSKEILMSNEVDTSFIDFLFTFGYNPEFQISRVKFPLEFLNFNSLSTIQANSWVNKRLCVDNESYTEISNGESTLEESNERVFSFIYTQSKTSSNYFFTKIDNRWYLTKISNERDTNRVMAEDFYTFLGKFCRDSIFQSQRIQFPLKVNCLDNDYNYIEKTITKDHWRYSGFYFSCDVVTNTYFNFNKNFNETDIRILIIHGIGNGINAQYTFKRIENKWILIKSQDYST